MGKRALNRKLKAEGVRLVKFLDKAEFPVSAALWFYEEWFGIWRFLISSPIVDNVGRDKALDAMESTLSQLSPPSEITLNDILVLSPNDWEIDLLRSEITTGSGIHGIELANSLINNVSVRGAYIYRLL